MAVLIKKIFNAVYYLFFAAIILAAVALMLTAFSIKGSRMFVVKSGSMQPAIRTGSVVFVSPSSSYKIGDIITFGPISKNIQPTTHRIIEIRAQAAGHSVYVTKGDANSATDRREVIAGDILGKVRFSVSLAGYFVTFAKTRLGFILLIIIPALIIIGDEVRKIWSEALNMKLKKMAEVKENKKR